MNRNCEMCDGTRKIAHANGEDDLEETECPECAEEFSNDLIK